jgi:hypothetical protein
MATYAGQFDYVSPGGGGEHAGACEFSFDERTATVVPASGPPLAFDLGDIDTFEAGEWDVRLALYAGQTLVLRRFGKALPDFARELLDAYRGRLVQCLLVSDLNEVARFDGRVRLQSPDRACAGPAEIRLYESNLAVLPDAAPGFQWRLADLAAVEFDEANYAVVLSRAGERLTVGHLAKRTGELAERVRSRLLALNARTARTLHALFPFLEPGPFRQAADLLRDGACAPMTKLDAVHASIRQVLIDKVVDADLKPYVKALAARASGHEWFGGLKVIRRESPESNGATEPAPADEAAEPASLAGGEVRPEQAQAPDEARDPAIFEAGDGLEVLYWFFFPLAAGPGGASHVAWEATSREGRATYLFRLRPGEPVEEATAAINRGLVALNFRREPVYLDARTLESELRYRHYAIAQRKVPDMGRVRKAFAGRAIHRTPASWARQIDGLLAG